MAGRLSSEVQQLLCAGIAERSGQRFLVGASHSFRLSPAAAGDGHATCRAAALAVHLSRYCSEVHRSSAMGEGHARHRAVLHDLYVAKREHESLLEFLRKSGSNGQISQRYRREHRSRKIQIPLETWINSQPADGQTLVAAITNSRMSDRFYGQWLLLNVPFRKVDDLWHPDAERLPHSLRHLGLCLLHRPAFWRSPDRPAAEMEQEARTDLHIKNFLSMLQGRVELIDAYLSGDLTLAESPSPALHGSASTSRGTIHLAAEQKLIIQTITSRVEAALQAKWPRMQTKWKHGASGLTKVNVNPFKTRCR